MVATDSLNVLETSPPRFTPDEVAAIAGELFGLQGEAHDLGSERDQTFMVWYLSRSSPGTAFWYSTKPTMFPRYLSKTR